MVSFRSRGGTPPLTEIHVGFIVCLMTSDRIGCFHRALVTSGLYPIPPHWSWHRSGGWGRSYSSCRSSQLPLFHRPIDDTTTPSRFKEGLWFLFCKGDPPAPTQKSSVYTVFETLRTSFSESGEHLASEPWCVFFLRSD